MSIKGNENHILVGLGGTGGKVLKAFRKRLFQEYSSEERAKLSIGYVYVGIFSKCPQNKMAYEMITRWRN